MQEEPIWQVVERQGAANADRVALVFDDVRYSCADVEREMRRAASALAAAGVGRGDRLAAACPLDAPHAFLTPP